MSETAILPEAFYAGPVVEVARSLIGRYLRSGEILVRISEVEAYAGPEDSASHARFGRTARNAPMWGPPGRLYVYLCYGIHRMLNVVVGPADHPSAILVRAAEPIAGLELIRARRNGLEGPTLLTGPGKIASALALGLEHNRRPLFEGDGLTLHAGRPPAAILSGPRVGIDYATAADRTRPWRFALPDSAWVTQRKALRADSSRRPKQSARATGR